MKQKNNEISQKLETLRRELGQTMIVHLGVPADGGVDILGIEFIPDSKTNKRTDKKESSLLNKELRYIG